MYSLYHRVSLINNTFFLALPVKPVCNQVYNLFLPFDPVASRLEPLIDQSFSSMEPVHVPRYQSFPFSNEILYKKREPKSQQRDLKLPDTPTLTVEDSSNGYGSSMEVINEVQSYLDSGNAQFDNALEN